MPSRSKDSERLGFPQPPWLLLGSALPFRVLAHTHKVGELVPCSTLECANLMGLLGNAKSVLFVETE